MKYSRLVKLAHSVLGDRLGELGFEFTKSGFVRNLPSLVRQGLEFELGSYSNETFSIRCGLTSPVMIRNWPSDGWFFVEYFTTDKQWHFNHGKWPCVVEENARESLVQIYGAIDSMIVPWLDAHSTLSQFADRIRDSNRGLWSGTLYFHDHNYVKAREKLTMYRGLLTARQLKPRSWDTSEGIALELAQVNEMLAAMDQSPGNS